MKLADYLQQSNLTDAEFGAKVDCSQSQVNRIKNGASQPSAELIARIRDETGGAVSFDDFYPIPIEAAE